MALKWFKKKQTEKVQPPEASQDHLRPSVDDEVPGEKAAGRGNDIETHEATEAVGKPPDGSGLEEAPPARETPAGGDEDDVGTDDGGQEQRSGFFKRLKKGLTKTREFLNTDIEDLFRGGRKLDEAMLEDLEELLITSDIGVQTTMDIIERVSKKSYQIKHAADLKAILKEEISAIIDTFAPPPQAAETRPHVIMVVGVNGVGKTTTIGKLAARYAESGKKVLIGASDTFRAAAIEQLSVWADRSGSQIVRHRDHADPAAVAFDAVDAAIARKADVVLIDTAGRLHTKVNLMEELKKIKRSLAKRLPEAPHETLLVLDATTGQNALSQAALFNDAIELSGLALTKLDGTAKGGIVVSICSTLNIPLLYIGVGEQLEDLQAFDPERFVDALF
ncbi:MAG: signal recognition particle-docking protein FtsY [Desulfobacterales bacterium]|jgi:fused signal recognition particle receptor